MTRLIFAVGILGFATFATAARVYGSQIVFSNLGPADSFQPNSSWDLNCCDSATSFTPTQDLHLDSIEIALEWLSFVGGTDAEDVWLASDSSGVPGQVLESFHIAGIPAVGTLMTASSVLHPMLVTGTQYWLVAASAPGIAWNWNNTGDTGFIASDIPGIWFVNRSTTGAFRVEGSEVPEPATLVFVSSGLVALLLKRIRV